jgi:hypothetical protein
VLTAVFLALRRSAQAKLDRTLWNTCVQLDLRRVKGLLVKGANPNAFVPAGAVMGDRVSNGSRPEQWIRHELHLPPIEYHVPFTMYQSTRLTLDNVYSPEVHIADGLERARAKATVASCKEILSLMRRAGGRD